MQNVRHRDAPNRIHRRDAQVLDDPFQTGAKLVDVLRFQRRRSRHDRVVGPRPAGERILRGGGQGHENDERDTRQSARYPPVRAIPASPRNTPPVSKSSILLLPSECSVDGRHQANRGPCLRPSSWILSPRPANNSVRREAPSASEPSSRRTVRDPQRTCQPGFLRRVGFLWLHPGTGNGTETAVESMPVCTPAGMARGLLKPARGCTSCVGAIVSLGVFANRNRRANPSMTSQDLHDMVRTEGGDAPGGGADGRSPDSRFAPATRK